MEEKMMVVMEKFNGLGHMQTRHVTELREYLDDVEDKDTKELIIKSFMGLMMDSICAEFGLDENKTWAELSEVHAEVNAQEGDFGSH